MPYINLMYFILKYREICSGDKIAWLEPCFKHFASLYLDIIKKQSGKATGKEFFGLRDFYRFETHMIMFAIHSHL